MKAAHPLWGKLVTMADVCLTHNALACLSVTMLWHAYTEFILKPLLLRRSLDKGS